MNGSKDRISMKYEYTLNCNFVDVKPVDFCLLDECKNSHMTHKVSPLAAFRL